MNIKSLQRLSLVNERIISLIQDSLMVKDRPVSTIRSLFSNVNKDTSLTREDTLFDLAAKGDVKARGTLMDLIIRLLSKEVRVKVKEIDTILGGYYINYYGSPSDFTTVSNPLLFEFLNKILISKDADYDTKIEKLAQVIYQECWGYGMLDEFRYFGIINDYFDKIEEIQCNGSNQLCLKISGTDFKLDKLFYPDFEIEKVAKKLQRNAERGLTRVNPKVETELVDGSRVTLTCPPLSANHSFNIRLHYSRSISSEDEIRIGSSSRDVEGFLDLTMNFHPRIMVVGGQGVGKTTSIVNICKRYPHSTSIVTAETSFELELDKIKYLQVQKLRLGVLSPEEFLESLFRFNADVLVMGEARSSSDVMLTTQVAKRQEFGTINTWHSGDASEGLRDCANALVRGGYFKTGREALVEICSSIDIVLVKRNVDKNQSHLKVSRHYYQICEVPKLTVDGNEPFKLNVLFEFNYEKGVIEKKNVLSEDMLDVFNKRVYNPKLIEVLRNGNYTFN